MKRHMDTNMKKCISMLLVFALLFQCFIYAPIPVHSVTSTQASGRFILGSETINYVQTLKANGDGTFSLVFELESASSVIDGNTDSSVSQNGYFTAPADGDYLVQLWGGTGGNGGAPEGGGQAGVGGAGGYVYGIISLKKGQTLYYQLGGNGRSTTSQDSGGGANGPGGHAGASTTNIVGGGGGYSAVYLFDEGEFENKYLDANGNFAAEDIVEADRVSKYIMIAGGGGGGGYGTNDAGSNAPSGGAGGTIGFGTSGITSDNGTFFAGSDGSTSGTNTDYVGKGGTNVPGEVRQAILHALGINYFSGLQANDWSGSYDAQTAGGNGGAGNLRGGSGGAGYAGGSGGVQMGVLLVNNIGGGGGGSSYISSLVRYTDLTEEETALLEDANSSNTGGGVVIKAVEDNSATSLAGLSLSATPSTYFTINNVLLDGEAVAAEDLTVGEDGLHTVSGIDITGGAKTLEIVLKPKRGFAGGNGVPLLTGNSITLGDGTNTASLALYSDCAKANVPLNFKAVGQNLMTNIPGTKFEVTKLYQDNVSDLDLSTWQYDFIASVGEYKVYSLNNNEITSDTIAPSETTRYYVGYVVTPKSGTAAVVGDVVKTKEIRAVAIVTVVSNGSEVLNGNTISYNKLLNYDSAQEEYVLSFVANISPEPLTLDEITASLPDASAGTSYYTIPYSGYYFIQAWGGKGGNGGSVTDYNHTGGVGGAGGYVEGYVYLEAGTQITAVVGEDGIDGDDLEAGRGSAEPDAGGYGGNTSVKIGETILLIAGGGGGGGAAWRSWGTGKAGYSGQSAYNCDIDRSSSSYCGSMSDIDTYYAENKSNTPWYAKTRVEIESDPTEARAGSYRENLFTSKNNPGGYAGSSIIGTIVNVKNTEHAPTQFDPDTVGNGYSHEENTNQKGGMVKITCLELTEPALPDTDMTNYVFQTELTRYFEVQSITCTDNKTGEKLNYSDETQSNNQITVEGITPVVESGTASFTIVIRFTPHTEFAGGNDVPVLWKANSAGLDLVSGMRLRQKDGDQDNYIDINVEGQDATDKANVPLNVAAIGSITPSGASDRTIDQETVTGIAPEALYTWKNRPDLGADDWRYDYVTTFETVTRKGGTDNLLGGGLITPDSLISTMYTVTVGIKPSISEPSAVVVETVTEESISQDVEIIVVPRVRYVLTNLTTSDTLDEIDGNFYCHVTPGESYMATLSPASGYELPAGITVTDFGGVDIPISYNSSTGQFTVPADYLIGTITVTAVARPKQYTITFYQQKTPGSTEFNTITSDGTNPYSFAAGDDLTGLTFPGSPGDVDGYTFAWDWGDYDAGCNTDDDDIPEYMPGKNLIVVGSYTPNKYPLTIYYYKDGTEEPVKDQETVQVPFGTDYTVTAPTIAGYVATMQTTTVTMDNINGKTLTIYYKASSGLLTVYYHYSNGNVQDSSTSYEISTDTLCEIPIASVYGYTMTVKDSADNVLTLTDGRLTVTPDATDVQTGIAVYVTYTPNTCQVTLDHNDGTDVSSTIYVEYDNQYNYYSTTLDGTKAYQTLPTPYYSGYTFKGWFVDTNGNGSLDEGETEVGERTIVVVSGAHTLTANWEEVIGTVTIRYVDDVGNVLKDVSIQYDGNKTGTYTPPRIYTYGETTYTTQTASVDYTFQTQNTVYRVTYYSPRTLTIYYYDSSTNELMAAVPTYTQTFNVGDAYSVASPSVEGYIVSHAVVSGEMGIEHLAYKVYYTKEETEKVVSVIVEWGSLDYGYTYGSWNPQTHQYDAPSIDPQVIGGNTIRVTSSQESTIPVYVSMSYDYSDIQYQGLKGHFTSTPYKGGTQLSQWLLNPDSSQTVYLWLTGTLPAGLEDSQITTGTVTVTISDPTGG